MSAQTRGYPAAGTDAQRVLIVEDEPKVASALREGLESEGYRVVVESTGEGAFRRATTEPFEAILLDLGLTPGPRVEPTMRDGIDVLRTLRSRNVDTPVLILTARDGLEQRVLGLDSGADDYLVRPFAFEEMLARLRALLRRPPIPEAVRLELLDLSIDLVHRVVTRGDEPIDLTLREFELLVYLARHAAQVVSRDTLARDVWKEPSRFTSLDNVIDVHVARLRKKIDMNHSTKLIHTVRGVGFMLGSDA